MLSMIDAIGRKILSLLQDDASLSVAEVAERVGLSQTPCWRRIQNLEKDGLIRKRVALLDGEKLGLGTTVFVAIKTDRHSASWIESFAKEVSKLHEVVEFYRMSGETDYLLRVVVPDIAGYDRFYKKLISVADLSDVSSSFAMEQIKFTTALPVEESSL